MTPKEQAKNLYDEFHSVLPSYNDEGQLEHESAKRCAIIAVDEILEVTAPYIDRYEPYYQELDDNQTQLYWQEVKQEIEKL